MDLDAKIQKLADKVEQLVRRELQPSDDCYHRTYLKELARQLKKRGEQRP
jgi:hypothetical protein